MGELTKKRVHWKEYNGTELIADEDVDVLTSADAVTFDDGETMQYKYSQGQFVSPSDMGYKDNLRTTNKSTLVDAINEIKTSATSNESSITSLTNRVSSNETDIASLESRMNTAESDVTSLETRVSTAENDINTLENRMDTAENDIGALETRMNTAETDIGALETRVTPLTLGGTGATSASGALSNLGITATASELNYVDGVTSNIQTQLNGKASSSHTHSASDVTSGTLPIARGGTGATSASGILSNLGLTATASELNKLDGMTATTTELNYVDGVTSNIQTQLNGKASTETYTATLSTSWSGDSAPYTQTVTVSGITSSDTPIVDVVLSTESETALSQLEAWGCVSQITTDTNSITATCLEDKPTTAIPIQLKVVR